MKIKQSARSHELNTNFFLDNEAYSCFFQHMAELLGQITDLTDSGLREVVLLAHSRTKADLTAVHSSQLSREKPVTRALAHAIR